jgi:hypothetical protein
LLRSLQASACPRGSLCARCKHENSRSNRTHGAREAPKQARGARKPHLDGPLRCSRCGVGQVRCVGPAETRTGGSSGSETRPTSEAQNSGACARAALRATRQSRNRHAVAENAGQVPLNPRSRQRTPLQQPCATGGSRKHGVASEAAPSRAWAAGAAECARGTAGALAATEVVLLQAGSASGSGCSGLTAAPMAPPGAHQPWRAMTRQQQTWGSAKR